MIECKACGHKSGWDYEEDINVNKDNPFIDIIGTFYRECGDYYKIERKISLVACPVCHTVIIVD